VSISVPYLVARQHLCKNVTMAANTNKSKERMLDASFFHAEFVSKKAGDLFFSEFVTFIYHPELLQRIFGV
jgi:hypothetical protein